MAKDTKKVIIETTIRLFKENGFDKTTVDMICKESQITKGTFYYHFKNKEQIAKEYYAMYYKNKGRDLMGELVKIDSALDQLWFVYADAVEKAIELGGELMRAFYMADFSNGMEFFSPLRQAAEGPIGKVCQNIIAKGQERGEIRQGDPERMHRTFMAAEFAIAYDWAFHEGDYDERPLIRDVFETIFI